MPYMSVYQKPFASPRVNGGVSGRGGLGAFWGKEWLPSKLFANGEQGAWYDPSDLSTLFQDAAGTVPVTAAGDPVGRMLDKSGRGNHATQTVSAARPTYQADGAKSWLAFDGVDDFMVAQSIGFGANNTASLFSAIKANPSSIVRTVFESFVNISTQGSVALQAPSSTEGTPSQFRTNKGGIVNTVAVGPGSNDAVLTGIVEELVQRFRINGTEEGATTVTAASFADLRLSIGARPEPSLFFSGRIYGLLFAARFISDGVGDVERYLAKKSGVTL